MNWLKSLKRTWCSAFGMPYFDVSMGLDGDNLVVRADFNAAFIRYLDKNGYANRGETPDEKVDAYMKDTWIAMQDVEEDDDDQLLPV